MRNFQVPRPLGAGDPLEFEAKSHAQCVATRLRESKMFGAIGKVNIYE